VTSCRRATRAVHALAVLIVLLAVAPAAHASTGSFERAFGRDVVAGNASFGPEVCTVAADCRASSRLGGELDTPSGVAENPSTGRVYVVDQFQHRVDRFAADGTWERAWGKDVDSGGGDGPEICTVRANCKAGSVLGDKGGEFKQPRGIAVLFNGDVVVADTAARRIQIFDADGNFKRAFGKNVGGGSDVCTVAAQCQAGTSGGGTGAFSFPTGVTVDGVDDSLFIADSANNRIAKYDFNGNFLLAFGKDVNTGGGTAFETCGPSANCKVGVAGGANGELSGPEDAGFLPPPLPGNGKLFVADTNNNRLSAYNPSTGAFLFTVGRDVDTAGGTGAETCTAANTCKAGVAGSKGGELLQPRYVTGNGLQGVWVSGNAGVAKFDDAGAWQFTFGKDVDAGNAGTGFEICAVAANCQGMSFGTLGGELRGGPALAATGTDVLYTAENRRVQKFDTSGTASFSRAWGRDVVAGGGDDFEVCTVAANCKEGGVNSRGGELEDPRWVATDPAGNAYVLDDANARVEKFDADGTFLRAWGKGVVTAAGEGEICTSSAACRSGIPGQQGGEFFNPSAIAADAAGHVYVADGGRIQRFDYSGNFQRAWGRDVDTGGGTGYEVCTVAASCKGGDGTGEGGDMSSVEGLAADATGVYAADRIYNRVQKFGVDGAWERAWGKDVSLGGAATGFETCTVASDCQPGAAGSKGGELSQPHGLALGAGKVFVADGANNRISVFGPDGAFVAERGYGVAGGSDLEQCTVAADCRAGAAGFQGGQLFNPVGIAADSAGRVYVTAFSARIDRYFADGTFDRAWGRGVDFAAPGTGFEVCTVAANCAGGSNGTLGGEMSFATGLAVGPAGRVLVADTGNKRIQAFGGGDPADPAPPADPGPTDPGPTDPGPTDPGPTDPGPTGPGQGGTPAGGSAGAGPGTTTTGTGGATSSGGGTVVKPKPSNAFKVGKLRKLVLSVSVRSAGTLTIKQSSLKTSRVSGRAGTIKVTLKPAKKAARTLKAKRKLTLKRVRITFAPAGGTPKTVTVTLKLKR
jgi:NHL repeat